MNGELMTNVQKLVEKSLSGENLSPKDALSILDYPDENILELLNAAYTVRKKYFGNIVHVQMLMNAKSGLCTEDCGYCTQSKVSSADIKEYGLKPVDDLVAGAVLAKKNGAVRYCMALSGIKYDDKLIDSLAESVSMIKKETGISICCSMGFITPDQAGRLKNAGLDRINHNLNSSREYYTKVCSTHTYDDRIKNISVCRAAGLEICSGGIIGLGEGKHGVVELFMELKKINPDSIPVNFYIPVKGTPFEKQGNELTPHYCLKVLCLARLMNPKADIRAAGGREYRLKSMQGFVLYAVNSIFVSGYLTTGGQPAGEGFDMIRDMGFKAEIEGVE
jgi:biotin synthase